MTPEQRERYLRHILLKEVGGQGQQKLLAARVLVIGAGGIGAPLIQYLAAAGVGVLGVADDDAVELSNLQRQVIYRTEDVGAAKTVRAAQAARAINPDIRVVEHRERIGPDNASGVFESYDVVVEGVDSFEARYDINRAAMARRAPLVSAALGRFEGQLSVFKPFAGPDLPCYRCFAPEPPPRDARIDCAEQGVLGPVAGVMGALAALETLKEILSLGESLAGRMLLFDGLAGRSRTVRLSRDPECADCRDLVRAKSVRAEA